MGVAPHELPSSAKDGALVRRTVLPGGIRVLTERMPGVRSATVGAWVGVGSRDEADGHHGSTHFLEHLLFKGTKKRTAMDIASALDEVGGESNAITAKEFTCYYARVLDSDVPLAVDVIGDMVTSATITPDDVDSERGVILEELAMNDDDPSDVVHEKFAEVVLTGSPLARPIGGTPASIEAVGREAIWAHYHEHYRPEGIVVAVAGGVDHDEVCGWVANTLKVDGWWTGDDTTPLAARAVAGDSGTPIGGLQGTVLTVQRPVEQAHVMMGCLSLRATDPRRYTMSVLNAVLGGGMSSRLFQEIREKRGLAYTVYSFNSGYADSGYFGMYAGCAPRNLQEVVDVLTGQWELLAEKGITGAELIRAQGQLAGGLVLGMEDSGSRMSRLGKAELTYGEFVDIDEALEKLRSVTVEQVQELAQELLGRPRSLVAVGPFEEDPIPSW